MGGAERVRARGATESLFLSSRPPWCEPRALRPVRSPPPCALRSVEPALCGQSAASPSRGPWRICPAGLAGRLRRVGHLGFAASTSPGCTVAERFVPPPVGVAARASVGAGPKLGGVGMHQAKTPAVRSCMQRCVLQLEREREREREEIREGIEGQGAEKGPIHGAWRPFSMSMRGSLARAETCTWGLSIVHAAVACDKHGAWSMDRLSRQWLCGTGVEGCILLLRMLLRVRVFIISQWSERGKSAHRPHYSCNKSTGVHLHEENLQLY